MTTWWTKGSYRAPRQPAWHRAIFGNREPEPQLARRVVLRKTTVVDARQCNVSGPSFRPSALLQPKHPHPAPASVGTVEHPRVSRADSVFLDRVASPATGRSPTGREVEGSGTGSARTPLREVPLFRRLLALLQPPLSVALGVDSPLEWYQELRQYQREGIAALISRPETLLADDMGLGKTIQAIGALRLLFRRQEIENALVVVPAGLVDQWRAEIAAWAPEFRVSVVRGTPDDRVWQWRTPVHVYLIGYETLRSDLETGMQDLVGRPWDVVVIDEAQKIKNRESATSIVVKKLVRRRSWALTGTPLENRLDDLESILAFLSPPGGNHDIRLRTLPGLRQRQLEVQLRRKKSQVLPQLPPKLVIRLPIELTDAQRREYGRLEDEGIRTLNEMGATARVEHVLELITRLKQVCNFSTAPRESTKLRDIEEKLEELVAEGHRALVFSQFADGHFGVGAILAELARFSPLAYTGALSTAQRSSLLRAFKSDTDHKVLILSLRAGGHGLNLQDASFVFHFDRWWNPAAERQAEDRAHRLGQTTPVTVYKYVCVDTIEERIDRILETKQGLFDSLIDDTSLDLRTRLTAQDLFGLFNLEMRSRQPWGSVSPVAGRFSSMDGQEFELYVKRKLESAGWSVSLTPMSRDGGIDLRGVRRDELGIEISLLVQCKNHRDVVGVEIVRAFNGVLAESERGTLGLLVCPGGFSADAREFARRAGILLWDIEQLSGIGSEILAGEVLDSRP